jgi:hypothetical protein
VQAIVVLGFIDPEVPAQWRRSRGAVAVVVVVVVVVVVGGGVDLNVSARRRPPPTLTFVEKRCAVRVWTWESGSRAYETPTISLPFRWCTPRVEEPRPE